MPRVVELGWRRPAPPPPPLRPLRQRAARAGLLAGGAGISTGAAAIGLAFLQARMVAAQPSVFAAHLDGRVGDPAGSPTHRVVWLGDSLAAGVGAVHADVSLPRLVAAGTAHPTRLHVFAVSGATSDDVVSHQLPLLAQLRHGLAQIGQGIDAIGVTVGANDIGALTPRRRFRRNLSYISASATGTPMILVSIPELADAILLPRPLRTFASWRARQLDRVLRRVASRHADVHYASVRQRPRWISRRDLPNFLAPDRYHPSGAGYAIWADTVAEAFHLALRPPD